MTAAPRFIPSLYLDNVENIEEYRPGGYYHPISIGDTFDQGRYRILHKLGFGGSSTVRLVRDQREGKDRGRIAALKANRADISSESPQELAISQKILESLLPSDSADFQTVDHHFLVQGPNGSHRFFVYPLSGPNILAMSDCPGRVAGSRRLRADLARKVAKQTATALHHMHSAGIVHGDLTTSNILFRLSPHFIGWSDAEVYAHLGDPNTERVETSDGRPNDKISHAWLLEESTIISDFGQSYVAACPPPSYEPGTMPSYQSPEARFEGRASFEADIWMLGCAIFEIRAGHTLFESFLGSDTEVLKHGGDTWTATRPLVGCLRKAGTLVPGGWRATERAGSRSFWRDYNSSQDLDIGERDDPPYEYEGRMIECSGVRLPEAEVDLLEDLLQKMLKYRPEERIHIQDVIRHPWFTS
ncbi:hypothetical protein H0H92_013934 [Tricholoma furcatifolium]|nr:hypothetical protein H0H92_013934 [Tricholoma furcatifolium]